MNNKMILVDMDDPESLGRELGKIIRKMARSEEELNEDHATEVRRLKAQIEKHEKRIVELEKRSKRKPSKK